MTVGRRRFRWGEARLLGGLLVAGLVADIAATARAEATPPAGTAICSPPCAAGQVCLHGSCWIQAPSSGAPAPSGPPVSAPDPPPGSYPPPNSYPPPTGIPYGYPTYSTWPPPGYATDPSPPVTSPPARRRNRLFNLIPYAGIHSYHGDGATNIGPGLHLGSLVGVRYKEVVSINGELTLDSVELRDLPAGEKLSELDLSATISPLFSIIDGKLELAFGPKLGFWLGNYSQSSPSRGDGSGSFFGWDLGANLAGMSQVGRHLWLGGLASFDLRTFASSCFKPTFGREGCTRDDLPPADKVLALSILLMFSI